MKTLGAFIKSDVYIKFHGCSNKCNNVCLMAYVINKRAWVGTRASRGVAGS